MEIPAIEVIDLKKSYATVQAVQALSFQVAPGEILGLVGPNGAGKTTTLRCLGGIHPPTSGSIRISGFDLLNDQVQAKKHLAFLPDEPRLFDYLTVQEHLNFIARIYQVENWETKAKRLLEELELSDKIQSLPGDLSRGMKQKLMIACGFLHDPQLVILDEPLTGLDPSGIRKMKRSLQARAATGTAIVLSSHLLPLVEELCHRILIIAHGRCVALGTLTEIRETLGATGSLEELFLHLTGEGLS